MTFSPQSLQPQQLRRAREDKLTLLIDQIASDGSRMSHTGHVDTLSREELAVWLAAQDDVLALIDQAMPDLEEQLAYSFENADESYLGFAILVALTKRATLELTADIEKRHREILDERDEDIRARRGLRPWRPEDEYGEVLT